MRGHRDPLPAVMASMCAPPPSVLSKFGVWGTHRGLSGSATDMVSLDGPPRPGTLENAVDVVTLLRGCFGWACYISSGKEETMLTIFLLVALGNSIPQADVNKICASAQVDVLPEDRASALRGCVGDETLARDQLRRGWGGYSAADKRNCAETPGMQFELCGIADVYRNATREQLRWRIVIGSTADTSHDDATTHARAEALSE